MTTFALVHGAWGTGWHWAGVPAELRRLGHEVVAPDLPCEDPDATFDDYADVVLRAVEGAPDDELVVVGFSLGGQTAARVAARRAVRELVYVAALIPEPGLSLSDQFARRDAMLLPEYAAGLELAGDSSHWVDFEVYWRTSCHDCEEPVARERFDRSRGQCHRPYRDPFSAGEMPAVPTRYIMCSEDRLMNNSFWRAAIRDPLETIPGSHSRWRRGRASCRCG